MEAVSSRARVRHGLPGQKWVLVDTVHTRIREKTKLPFHLTPSTPRQGVRGYDTVVQTPIRPVVLAAVETRRRQGRKQCARKINLEAQPHLAQDVDVNRELVADVDQHDGEVLLATHDVHASSHDVHRLPPLLPQRIGPSTPCNACIICSTGIKVGGISIKYIITVGAVGTPR